MTGHKELALKLATPSLEIKPKFVHNGRAWQLLDLALVLGKIGRVSNSPRAFLHSQRDTCMPSFHNQIRMLTHKGRIGARETSQNR